MATPADQPLKKIFWVAVGCLSSPPTPLFHFFSSFNLGVAMVAIVAVKIPRTSAVFPPGAELPSVAGTATPAGCPAHTPRLHALVRVSRGARVLEHRTRRPVVSPRPSHARPARVRSQVLSILRRGIEDSCSSGCARDRCEDRASGVTTFLSNGGPSDGPTARAARDSAALPHELPRDGRRRSVPTLCRTGGRGRTGGRCARSQSS